MAIINNNNLPAYFAKLPHFAFDVNGFGNLHVQSKRRSPEENRLCAFNQLNVGKS